MITYRPIIAGLMFLGALSVFLLLSWPAYQNFKTASQNLKNAKTEYQYVSDYYMALEQLQKRIVENEPFLAKIDAALPSKPSLPALFNYIQTTSSQNGLVLSDVGKPAVEDSKVISGIKENKMELSLAGSYPSLKNFLSSIYKNSRLIDINSIKFSAPEKEKALFDFKVTIRTQNY